jgi:hypothetical protein
LAQADGQVEEEQKKVDEIFERIRGENVFYNNFGRGMARLRTPLIGENWRYAECVLNVKIEGSSFSAIGQYEFKEIGLGALMPALGGATPQQWMIEYRGVIHGVAIEAEVFRENVEDRKSSSFLSRIGSGGKALMVLSDDGEEFAVMEKWMGGPARFYNIAREF